MVRRPSRTGRIVVVVVMVAVGLPVVAALIARTFLVEVFTIPSGGMMPTLLVGDQLLADKSLYGWRREAPRLGDVVVFRFPREPDKDFAQRIVGLAGDTLEVRERALWRNGAAVPRCRIGPYHVEGPDPYEATSWLERTGTVLHLILTDDRQPVGETGPWRVPRGQVFTMGDSRDNSFDGRFWGGVPLENLKARASTILSSQVTGRSGLEVHAPPALAGAAARELARCRAALGTR